MTTQTPIKSNPEAAAHCCFYCAKTAIEFLPEAAGDISRPVCRTHYESKHGALQATGGAVPNTGTTLSQRTGTPAPGGVTLAPASPPTLTLRAPEQGALFE